MWRFLMIGFLAVFLPMGIGATEIEKYDGTQDAETWFFDNILDENGELLLKDYYAYMGLGFWQAEPPILDKYFGCIPAPGHHRPDADHDIFVIHHIIDLSTRPPVKFTLQDDRYLIYRACQHQACTNESHHIIDTKDKALAVATVMSRDILRIELDAKGKRVYDSDNPYIKLFISENPTEEFITMSKKLAKTVQKRLLDYRKHTGPIREIEIVRGNCR